MQSRTRIREAMLNLLFHLGSQVKQVFDLPPTMHKATQA